GSQREGEADATLAELARDDVAVEGAHEAGAAGDVADVEAHGGAVGDDAREREAEGALGGDVDAAGGGVGVEVEGHGDLERAVGQRDASLPGAGEGALGRGEP